MLYLSQFIIAYELQHEKSKWKICPLYQVFFFFVLRILHQVILSLFGRFKWEWCAQDGCLCHYIEGENELKKAAEYEKDFFSESSFKSPW